MAENINFDFNEAPLCITSLECARLRALENNSEKINLLNLDYGDLSLIQKSLELYSTIGEKLERIETFIKNP